jgi:hypothetical protein
MILSTECGQVGLSSACAFSETANMEQLPDEQRYHTLQ